LGVEPSFYCDELQRNARTTAVRIRRGAIFSTTPTPAAMTKLYPNG
jgi:hypothetical protein